MELDVAAVALIPNGCHGAGVGGFAAAAESAGDLVFAGSDGDSFWKKLR